MRTCDRDGCENEVIGRPDKIYCSTNCREKVGRARYRLKYRHINNEKNRNAMRNRRQDPKYRHISNEKSRNAMRRRAEGNAEKLHRLKSNSCMDCGHTQNWWNMHFDHRPGVIKLFEIARYRRHSWDDVLAEIAKCDLVCSHCHGDRTMARRGITIATTENANPTKRTFKLAPPPRVYL